jgi:hypothetical protein
MLAMIGPRDEVQEPEAIAGLVADKLSRRSGLLPVVASFASQ